MPFARAAGVVFTKTEPEEVRARLDWSEDRCTVGGLLHGGAIATLVDSTGAVLAFLNLPPGAATATVGCDLHLLRGVRSGWVEATATAVHIGSRFITVSVQAIDADGRAVAVATQTQAVLPAQG